MHIHLFFLRLHHHCGILDRKKHATHHVKRHIKHHGNNLELRRYHRVIRHFLVKFIS